MKAKLITITLVSLVGILIVAINQSNSAHIEKVLVINPTEINFGNVFPYEYLEEAFKVQLSDAFMTQEGVTKVDYKIVQKPKCKVWEADECKEYYRTLCPYLNKVSTEDENDTENNSSLNRLTDTIDT